MVELAKTQVPSSPSLNIRSSEPLCSSGNSRGWLQLSVSVRERSVEVLRENEWVLGESRRQLINYYFILCFI